MQKTDIAIPALAYKPVEAAAIIRCSKTRIYELLKSGELKAKKNGTATLILVSELERWLGGLPEMKTAKAIDADVAA